IGPSSARLAITSRPLRFSAIAPGVSNRASTRKLSNRLLPKSISPCAATASASDRSRSRSEEHTSELQSLMRISYAVFCLKKKKNKETHKYRQITHQHTQP